MLTIYTKSYCPFCHAAKNLLQSLHAKFDEIDITNKPKMIDKLEKKSHMRTVPQIFLGDRCLGGFSDVEKLHNEGKLVPLLRKNG